MTEANLCLGCMKLNKGEATCPFCGFDEKNHLEKLGKRAALYLKLGTMLAGDQYIVGKPIGQGSFGITYIGLDTRRHQRIAIKEYMPRSLAFRSPHDQHITPFNEDNRLSFAFGLQQFIKEAGILASITGEAGIIAVYHGFQQHSTGYFIMEYLEGRTLELHLQHHLDAMDWDDSREIAESLMKSLAAVHEAGLLHRDISPENIFLCSDGSIRLIDFGGARQALIDQNKNLSVILKPGYAPLENYVSRGKRGPWTDNYSLAATVFRMLTGTRIPEAMVRMSNDTLEQRMAEAATIPEAVKPVLLKALSIQPEDRYADTREFQADFESAADVQGPAAAVSLDAKESKYIELSGRVNGEAASAIGATARASGQEPVAAAEETADNAEIMGNIAADSILMGVPKSKRRSGFIWAVTFTILALLGVYWLAGEKIWVLFKSWI